MLGDDDDESVREERIEAVSVALTTTVKVFVTVAFVRERRSVSLLLQLLDDDSDAVERSEIDAFQLLEWVKLKVPDGDRM